jgi:ribonuclease HI
MKSWPAKPASGKLLFDTPDKPTNIFIVNVDGASRGNPGPAAYAVILRGPDGGVRFEVGKYIGRATNNVAEYYALITALDYAASQRIDRLLVRSDSELLVRQMQGRYKVKSTDLRPLYERARKLANGFAYFVIEHVPREQNRDADELANIALDRTDSRGSEVTRAISGVKAEAKPTLNPRVQTNVAAAAQAAGHNPSGQPARSDHPIRARYSAGALHPFEALDLSEGDIVEVSIRRARTRS